MVSVHAQLYLNKLATLQLHPTQCPHVGEFHVFALHKMNFIVGN